MREDQRERYHKQILVREFGEAGQDALLRSSVALVGCGALGSAQASHLARAGIGQLTLIDDDTVERSNLHRQFLFDEEDAQAVRAKVDAAAEKLTRANSGVSILPKKARADAHTIARLCEGADIIIDATDNFPTRYIINEYCVGLNIPWIYGGVLANAGMSLTILPRQTPCLACLHTQIPNSPDCTSTGVLAPVVHTIAAIQALEAIKILCGKKEALQSGMLLIDLWNGQYSRAALTRREDCPVCAK